jgi:hypothetical protein
VVLLIVLGKANITFTEYASFFLSILTFHFAWGAFEWGKVMEGHLSRLSQLAESAALESRQTRQTEAAAGSGSRI